MVSDDKIQLSQYSKALIDAVSSIKKRRISADAEKISVSQTVSFFAILYEKARNAIEFREEHLVRRAAIERILKRRLSMNPSGRNEGENLIRELLWARYIPNESVTQTEIDHFQNIINKYLYLRKNATEGQPISVKNRINEFLLDFLTCEIEEELNPDITARKTAYRYFFYQVLKNKIKIESVEEEEQDSYFYIATEQALAKNDLPYIRYHLFLLMHKKISLLTQNQLDKLATDFDDKCRQINQLIKNKYSDKLVRFARRHVPPFLILFALIEKFPNDLQKKLTDSKELWSNVDSICRKKYEETGVKIRNAAIRSVIYIFLTKALLAIVLEVPLSQIIYNEINLFAVGVNTLFPPVLMAAIVSFVNVPGSKNTKRIYERIVDILNRDPSFETRATKISSKSRVKRPVLVLGFTIFYLLTFLVTFSLIFVVLELLGFNLISITVFLFFVSLIAFFGYRIRQTAKEYTLAKKQGIFSPIIDFFFVPIVSVGKVLSQEISKLNIFILIFDFLIEAPFKLISEIIEEWISFVRARKEEIF